MVFLKVSNRMFATNCVRKTIFYDPCIVSHDHQLGTDMHPFHPVFAVVLTLLAFLTVKATFLFVKTNPPAMRFASIDGLRGYLAFFVVLHHASIWATYLKTGFWVTPTSYLYAQFGQVSVLLFFMITSFLFYDKLLNSQGRAFDWRGFFIGRFFRMAPLYGVVMIILLLIVASLSHWHLMESPQAVLTSVASWLLFSIPGLPVINGVNETSLVVAGVTWSLRYEWCFYLALPLISLTTRQRPGLLMLLVSAAGLAIGWLTGLKIQFAAVFAGGMLAACLVRDPRFIRLCKNRLASLLLVICFAVILQYPNSRQLIPCATLVVVFCLIAGGADLFGLLCLPTSHRFGEIAYGIYLIHGIVLFSMVNFVVGQQTMASMSAPMYWLCVALAVPVILGLSGLAYHYVEHPGINLGKRLRRWDNRLPAGEKV